MTSDKVCLCDIVRALDGLVAESQVRDRDAAGLFGVVLEISLNVFVGMVADDLDRVLVRADRSVAAESPELAGNRSGSRGIRAGLFFERKSGHVVNYADREVSLRLVLRKIFVNREDGRRRGIL